LARSSRKKTARPRAAQSETALQRLECSITGNYRRVIIVSLLVNLLACLALFDPKPHTGGDNASYIILAQSILRTGDGYSDNITTDQPRPHTQYPFGYPLLLAPLVAVAGADFVVLKFLSVAFAVASVGLFSLLLRRIFPPLPGALLSFAVALNPVVVEYSHWVLSEGAFLFFSLLSLYLLLDAEQQKHSAFTRKFWLALVAVGFTAYIRTVGLGFGIAAVVYFAIGRRWRTLAIFALGLAVLLGPWMIRNHLVRSSHSGYVSQLFMKNPYTPEAGTVGVGDLVARFAENVKIYAGSQVARVLVGSMAFKLGGKLILFISLAASMFFLLGLFHRIRQKLTILEVYVLVYTAIVLLWPQVWSDVRFLMPIVPLILLYLIEGAMLLGGVLPGRETRDVPAGAAAALLVIGLGLGAQLALVPDNLDMLGRYLKGDRYAGYPANWRNLFMAGDWIRQNTPRQSVITVRKPRLFYLHTGRKVDGYPFTTNTDSVLARITATDYVVIDAVSGTTYRYLIPAVRKAPERFKLVYNTRDPFTGVLEVVQ